MAMPETAFLDQQSALHGPERPRLTLVPSLKRDSRSASPAPSRTLAMHFGELSDRGKMHAGFQRTMLAASGVKDGDIIGVREVQEQEGLTSVDVFVSGNSDLPGAKIHEVRNDKGELLRTETVFSVKF